MNYPFQIREKERKRNDKKEEEIRRKEEKEKKERKRSKRERKKMLIENEVCHSLCFSINLSDEKDSFAFFSSSPLREKERMNDFFLELDNFRDPIIIQRLSFSRK